MNTIWVWIVSFFVWLSADKDLLPQESARAAAAGAATAAVFAVETPKPAPAPKSAGTCTTGTCAKR